MAAEPGKQEPFITRESRCAARARLRKRTRTPRCTCSGWGPEGQDAANVFELRDGGVYRFVHTDADGKRVRSHGVYHEVLAPERIISTFEFEGLPEKGHVILQTARFEALPGNRTRLTGQAVYQSVEDRDGMIQSGMETGVNEGYERLDELVAKIE